jgi:hypothetical protein
MTFDTIIAGGLSTARARRPPGGISGSATATWWRSRPSRWTPPAALRLGDRADLFLLDPTRLDDSLTEYAEAPVAQYDGLSRMVNRNDATVPLVMVGGRVLWRDGEARFRDRRPAATTIVTAGPPGRGARRWRTSDASTTSGSRSPTSIS